jgi:plasmid stability protein
MPDQNIALNIRPIDPALRAALKSEAAAHGKGISEYAIEILASRHLRQLPPSAAVSERPGGYNVTEAATDPVSGKALVQEPPPALGMWDDEPTKASGAPAVEPVSGPGVVATVKPQCAHGYMNRKLCPQCRAGV